METAILVLLYIFVVLLDFIPLIKGGKKKEGLVYFGILLSSIIVFVLYKINPALTNVTKLLDMLGFPV